MLAVDGIVQLTHVVIGYLSRQLIQRGSYARDAEPSMSCRMIGTAS